MLKCKNCCMMLLKIKFLQSKSSAGHLYSNDLRGPGFVVGVLKPTIERMYSQTSDYSGPYQLL